MNITKLWPSLVVFIVLSGCSMMGVRTPSLNVEPFDICGVDKDKWKIISTDQRRVFLKSDIEITRQFFTSMGEHDEIWFTDGNDVIVGCGFRKKSYCGGGLVNIVEIKRMGNALEYGPIIAKFCSN